MTFVGHLHSYVAIATAPLRREFHSNLLVRLCVCVCELVFVSLQLNLRQA